MPGWVYIVTNRRNVTLYLGVTDGIARRTCEHRYRLVDEFLAGMASSDWSWRSDLTTCAQWGSVTEYQALAMRLEDAPDPRSEPLLG
jgi:predicted GIY-YIG superfamily endonuclease